MMWRGSIVVALVGALSACGATRSWTVSIRPLPDAGVSIPILPPPAPDAGFDAGVPIELDAGDEDAVIDAGPPPPVVGPFPIVLMHGMGGFNQLENLPITMSYFNGVQAD